MAHEPCNRPTRRGPCERMIQPGEECTGTHEDNAHHHALDSAPSPSPRAVDDGFGQSDLTVPDDLAALIDDDGGVLSDDGWGPAPQPELPAPTPPHTGRSSGPALSGWRGAEPAQTGFTAPSLVGTSPSSSEGHTHASDAKKAVEEEHEGAPEILVVERDGNGRFHARTATERPHPQSWIQYVRTLDGMWHSFKSSEIAEQFCNIETLLIQARKTFLSATSKAMADNNPEARRTAADLSKIIDTLRGEREALVPRIDYND